MATAALNVRVASCCHIRYDLLLFKNHSGFPDRELSWRVKVNEQKLSAVQKGTGSRVTEVGDFPSKRELFPLALV